MAAIDRLIAADGWGITCQCGHFDVHEQFENYDNSRQFQCPECGVEWVIDSRVLTDGRSFSFLLITNLEQTNNDQRK